MNRWLTGVLNPRGRGHLSGAAAGVSSESFWCPLACQKAQDQVYSEFQVNLGPLWKRLFRNLRCFRSWMAWWKSVHMRHSHQAIGLHKNSISWKLPKQIQLQKWSKSKEKSPNHEVSVWPRCPSAETLQSCTSRASTLTGSSIPF